MTVLFNAILVLTVTACLIGLGVAAWSIIDTKKRYYEDFVRRRNRRAGD